MRKAKRPPIISTICALGLAGTALSFISVFSPAIKKLGIFMPAVYGLVVCGYFTAYIGLWYMKRWGAELYVVSFCASLILAVLNSTFGLGNIIGIVWTIFCVVVLFIYYKRMDVNL